VRDDESCPALHEIRKTVLNHRLRFRIQAGCSFVEDQDSRLGKIERAMRCVAFVPGKFTPRCLRPYRIYRKALSEFVHPRNPAGAHDFLFARLRRENATFSRIVHRIKTTPAVLLRAGAIMNPIEPTQIDAID